MPNFIAIFFVEKAFNITDYFFYYVFSIHFTTPSNFSLLAQAFLVVAKNIYQSKSISIKNCEISLKSIFYYNFRPIAIMPIFIALASMVVFTFRDYRACPKTLNYGK